MHHALIFDTPFSPSSLHRPDTACPPLCGVQSRGKERNRNLRRSRADVDVVISRYPLMVDLWRAYTAQDMQRSGHSACVYLYLRRFYRVLTLWDGLVSSVLSGCFFWLDEEHMLILMVSALSFSYDLDENNNSLDSNHKQAQR
jgi:hypothetical protein